MCRIEISIENREIYRTKIVVGLAQISFIPLLCTLLYLLFDFAKLYVYRSISSVYMRTCMHTVTEKGQYRSVSSCTISRWPQNPRLSATCIHWVYRIVSQIPGALKLALRNNSAVSKARGHSRASCSLILNAFIYFDRVHRVHPRITRAVRSPSTRGLCGFAENGI